MSLRKPLSKNAAITIGVTIAMVLGTSILSVGGEAGAAGKKHKKHKQAKVQDCVKGVTGSTSDKSLTLGFAGGAFETTFKNSIIPRFEEDTGIQVTYTGNPVTTQMTKLITEVGHPTWDVMITIPGSYKIGVTNNALSKIKLNALPAIKAYKKRKINLRQEKGEGVQDSASFDGIWYNPRTLSQHNIKPPKSIKDLFNPALAGHVLLPVPPVSDSYVMFQAFNHAYGGSVGQFQ